MRIVSFLLVSCFVLGGVATAAAQDDSAAPSAADERARQLYLKGDRLYSEGRYEAALEAFSKSFELSGKPLLLFNMANAYERLGRYEEALAALRQYAPDAPAYEHDTIQRRMRSLDARLEDGEPAAPARAPVDEPPVAAQLVEPGPPPEPERPTAGYALLGTGAGLAAAGLGFALGAWKVGNDLDDVCVEGICREGADGDLDREKLFSGLADGLFAAAGVAAAVGLVLVLTHDGGEDDVGQAKVQIQPTLGGAEVSFAGRF